MPLQTGNPNFGKKRTPPPDETFEEANYLKALGEKQVFNDAEAASFEADENRRQNRDLGGGNLPIVVTLRLILCRLWKTATGGRVPDQASRHACLVVQRLWRSVIG